MDKRVIARSQYYNIKRARWGFAPNTVPHTYSSNTIGRWMPHQRMSPSPWRACLPGFSNPDFLGFPRQDWPRNEVEMRKSL